MWLCKIRLTVLGVYQHHRSYSRARSEPGGTRWRTGGEVKGKLANGVSSQYSHATSERGLSSITQAEAHTSAASIRLNWRPHRFKWTRPFRGKTKSGFRACAITFRMSYTADCYASPPSCLAVLFWTFSRWRTKGADWALSCPESSFVRWEIRRVPVCWLSGRVQPIRGDPPLLL